ncbi:MAG: hypothetical protein HZC28_04900 [Spirochaetes bacterium]|nr:hypothetical protein [Spirochaetota bacterium]
MSEKMPHKNHTAHLCHLRNIGSLEHDYQHFASLVSDGRYLCATCGRVAKNRNNLCKPKPLQKNTR